MMESRVPLAFGDFFLPTPYFYDDHQPPSHLHTAAVLILLYEENAATAAVPNPSPPSPSASTNSPPSPSIHVLLTVRSRLLRRHPGEVCFPGGMRDQQIDKTPVETALRETYEEIGLPPAFVHILGTLRPFVSLHHIRIFPVLGRIDRVHRQRFRPFFSQGEVEDYFWAPLARFLSPDGHRTFAVPNADTLMHIFTFNGRIVFGITAILCVAIAVGLMARLPAFPERIHNDDDGISAAKEGNDEGEKVLATLRAMFRQFGQVREFVEPRDIHAAMPSSKL